jgi:hypothetical protein
MILEANCIKFKMDLCAYIYLLFLWNLNVIIIKMMICPQYWRKLFYRNDILVIVTWWYHDYISIAKNHSVLPVDNCIMLHWYPSHDQNLMMMAKCVVVFSNLLILSKCLEISQASLHCTSASLPMITQTQLHIGWWYIFLLIERPSNNIFQKPMLINKR